MADYDLISVSFRDTVMDTIISRLISESFDVDVARVYDCFFQVTDVVDRRTECLQILLADYFPYNITTDKASSAILSEIEGFELPRALNAAFVKCIKAQQQAEPATQVQSPYSGNTCQYHQRSPDECYKKISA